MTRVLRKLAAVSLSVLALAGSGCAKADTPKPRLRIAQVTPKQPGKKENGILVVYPPDNSTINSASTFLIGAVESFSEDSKTESGPTLSCNGKLVKLSKKGFFAHVVKLERGQNNFSLSFNGRTNSICLRRPPAPETVSPGQMRIIESSIEPKEDLGVQPGDIIQFALRATPGGIVNVKLGEKTVPLKQPQVPKSGRHPRVNLGMATAFGISYQKNSEAPADLYVGFYKVQPADQWQKIRPIFRLSKGSKDLAFQSKRSISVLNQPNVFCTKHKDTIVRLGPDAARTTPLPEAVRFICDGFRGPWYRLELSPNKHVWINREDLEADEESHSPPQAQVSTINLQSDAYGARVVLPLSERLPYQIEQDLKSGKLTLKLFGATANTDWVTAEPISSGQLGGDGRSQNIVDYVLWKQKDDSVYELSVQLKTKVQWGFWADYEGNDLVLHIKSAPVLKDPDSLSGLTVCLDPGHGGMESGSIGCSGMKESTLNLQIAERTRDILRSMGAKVIMTREQDDLDVSLAQRVAIAIAAGADILVSIHNNALPDGRDPWKEHGSSSYWYHPQSLDLARTLKNGAVEGTGFPDYGVRWQNLFLCRPSHMPASLVEVGFMINPEEFGQLIEPDFQQSVARGLADNIRQYFISKPKQAETERNKQP